MMDKLQRHEAFENGDASIYPVSKNIAECYPDLNSRYERSESDYLFDTELVIQKRGKKYQAIRKAISRATEKGVRVLNISMENILDAISVNLDSQHK